MSDVKWPERLTLRDTKVIADEGQRIFSTATGYGYEKREYVRADLAASPASPSGAEDGRTLTGETCMGMPVAAYMAESRHGPQFNPQFACHWSTLPKHTNPERLFREADVRATLAKPASEPAGGGVREQGFVDGYEAALRDVQVFRIKIAEPFDSTFATHKGFVTDMLKDNAGRLRTSLSSPASSEAEALQAGVEAELSRMRFELSNRVTVQHEVLMAEALAEIKATVDGDSDQPVRDIIYGLLAEIENLPKRSSAPAQEDGKPPECPATELGIITPQEDGSKELGAHPRVSGQSAGSVAVKSLVWAFDNHTSLWWANSPVGRYQAWEISGYAWFKLASGEAKKGGSTLEEAQYAAQKHFESKVRDCLEGSPCAA